MKRIINLVCIFSLLAVLLIASPTSVYAENEDNTTGHMVFGSSYTLDSGDTLIGDLLVFGGNATLMEGSVIEGDVMIAGGTLNASGTINGSIITFGGIVNLDDTAVINGDLASFGGTFNRSPNATVTGDVISDFSEGAQFDLPFDLDQLFSMGNLFNGNMSNSNGITELPRVNLSLRWAGKLILRIAEALGMAIIAVIAALFLAKPMERVGQTLVGQTPSAIGLGILTALVFPALMIILMITIILIPISILGLLVYGLTILFGWLAIGMELGKRIADLLNTDFSDPVSAGVGTLVLALVSSIFSVIPCIGWLVPFLIASLGLGAVILSKFGSIVYAKQTSLASSSTTTPTAAVSTVPVKSAPPISAEEALKPLDLDAIDLDQEQPPELDEIPPTND